MHRARVLGLFVALVAAYVIVRWSGRGSPDRPRPDAGADAATAAPPPVPVDVTEILLDPPRLERGDGAAPLERREDSGEERRSVRVLHPDAAVRQRLLSWLEPREKAAVARNAALQCVADTATRRLVSLRCVTVPPQPPDASPPDPVYATLVLRVEASGPRELAITDVLRETVGREAVVDACQKAADPPLPCAWPPTAFSVVGGETLFVCRDHHCVDLDETSALVKADLASAE